DDATPHIGGSSVACREHRRRPIASTSSCCNTSILHLELEMSAIAMFFSCTF
ncbi:unnamed protein product, partial [Musa acuminata subsp. burmannicoides]